MTANFARRKATSLSPRCCRTVTVVELQRPSVLPFTREVPVRRWFGFVPNPDETSGSPLTVPLVVLTALGIGILAFSGGATKVEHDAMPPSSAAAARHGSATMTSKEDADDASVGRASGAQSDDAPTHVDASTAPNDAPDPSGDVPQLASPAIAKPASTASDVVEEPQRAPKPKREPKPLSAAAQRRAERAATKLRDAIASSRVVASPENFVVVSANGDASWNDATTTCAALNIDGVQGWKLPSRGEARELQRGRALRAGAYWTRQRAAKHDDSIYVHDTRTRRSAPWLDVEIAGVVCVQPRPRDPA